jgi:cysteine sulfinate desulfinase/cysteine desulfurase-like protein
MQTLLTSKTAWTFVVLFIISGTNGVMGLIPPQYIIYIQMVLTALGAYFHVDTVNVLKGQVRSLGGYVK